jgi:hypothetical protein
LHVSVVVLNVLKPPAAYQASHGLNPATAPSSVRIAVDTPAYPAGRGLAAIAFVIDAVRSVIPPWPVSPREWSVR